jgi:hypothetical protein
MTTDATPLTTPEDRSDAHRIEESIFVDFSARSKVFTSDVPCRGLIYPITYWLDEKTFEALRSAASGENDQSFYLAFPEKPRTSDGPLPDRWRVPFDYAPYRAVADLPLEMAHYSTTGKWGVLTTSSQIALVGGSQMFAASLERKLDNDFEENARRFLHDYFADAQIGGWKTDWLPPLMTHLFGADAASTLLAATAGT